MLLALLLPLTAHAVTLATQTGPLRLEVVTESLDHPWGLVQLPDDSLLVTERCGRLRHINTDGTLSAPYTGVPPVYTHGKGGLLDVTLDPAFSQNQRIYLAYAEADPADPRRAATAVARGRLEPTGLSEVTVIFRQLPKVESEPTQFGARLLFAPDGNLFVTLGERYLGAPAQDNHNHLGTIVRITAEGSVPPDNPLVGRADALPEIWSFGHRNVQGAAIHPSSGELWSVEHGPHGGDELNIARPGRNYGWPLVSWGNNYDGSPIPGPPVRPDLAQAIFQWTPAIAPSGMTFYTANRIPGWHGNLLVGGLMARAIVRMEQNGRTAREVERIPIGARVRTLLQGHHGELYVLTDETHGQLLRLLPATAESPLTP